jgi:hypothetical protein
MKALKVVLLAAVVGLSACKGEKHRPEDKAEITANDKTSAEQLVESTEQLVTPYSFMLAYKMADMALKKDPNNLKAKFYVLLLKRFEVFNGIATRMRPMLKEDEIKKLDKEISEYPDSPIKKFLTASGPEIKSEADAQKLIESYFAAVGEFHKFLKENEDKEFVVNFNPYVFKQPLRKEAAADFKAAESADGISVKMDKTLSKTAKLNIADLIVLRQAAGAELLSGLFTYSYDLSGLAKLRDQKKRSDEEILNLLFESEQFGKLKENHGFSQLPLLGSDMAVAAAWVIKYQDNLCPGGSSETRSKFLIDDMCDRNPNQSNKLLALLNSALKGAVDLDYPKSESKVKIDFFNLSKNPIKDLRSIKPSFDNKGCADSFADNSLGGVFVDKNADSVLLKCAE